MAKVDRLELRREDFPGVPDKLLQMLTGFSTQVAGAVKGGLSVGENVRGFVKEVTLTTGSTTAEAFPLRFPNELSGSPVGMTIVGAWNITDGGKESPVCLFGPAWKVSGSDLVLSDLGNLSTSSKYRVKLLVW